jgi:hypothetical protein
LLQTQRANEREKETSETKNEKMKSECERKNGIKQELWLWDVVEEALFGKNKQSCHFPLFLTDFYLSESIMR